MAGIYNDRRRWTGEARSEQYDGARVGRGGRRRAMGAGSESALPLLRAAAQPYVRRPRHVAAVSNAHRAAPAEPYGALLSAARLGVRALLSGAAGDVRRAGRHLFRLRLLLVVLRQLGGAR